MAPGRCPPRSSPRMRQPLYAASGRASMIVSPGSVDRCVSAAVLSDRPDGRSAWDDVRTFPSRVGRIVRSGRPASRTIPTSSVDRGTESGHACGSFLPVRRCRGRRCHPIQRQFPVGTSTPISSGGRPSWRSDSWRRSTSGPSGPPPDATSSSPGSGDRSLPRARPRSTSSRSWSGWDSPGSWRSPVRAISASSSVARSRRPWQPTG